MIPDLSGPRQFNFTDLIPYCDKSLILALKRVLVYYLEQKSVSHPHNIFERFKSFVIYTSSNSDCVLSVISSVDIINYKSTLQKNQEWYLGVLRGLFKKWYALGYPGVENKVIELLKHMRLRGNLKGDAVRTMDPDRGPFTEIELQGIHTEINTAYAGGEISTREFVLIWLFMALGSRGVQIAALKIKDFNVQHAQDGSTSYLLNVPRAKQRGGVIRDQFKQRSLINDIGKALEAWIASVRSEYNRYKKLHRKNSSVADADLPIFPNWAQENPVKFEHHANALDLAREVEKSFNELKVFSERTGNILKISTRRFRYTVGTRAAMEGYNELVIAELLDHTDTQNVSVYVQSNPTIIKRIDKALALQMAPRAQAFMGIMISDESEVASSSCVRSPKSSSKKPHVGNCGRYGFCGAFAPISCYTCRYFQAWIDGPHMEILEDLISERDRLLRETGDERIAFANDRTILAVAEVVRKCGEIREQMETA